MEIKTCSSAKAIITILEELGIDSTDLFILAYILIKDDLNSGSTYANSFKNDKGEIVRIWYKKTSPDKYILVYDIE